MPVTFLQLGVLLLAMRSMGGAEGATAWTAFIFPFSSPLSMIAFAAQDDRLWPHAAALVWQAVWAVIIVRLSARMFRATVLKSGGRTSFWAGIKSWGRAS
jgi:ABC-2 type transport system permease protein